MPSFGPISVWILQPICIGVVKMQSWYGGDSSPTWWVYHGGGWSEMKAIYQFQKNEYKS